MAPATPIAQLRALVNDLGPAAFASGTSAAGLHGFDGFDLRSPFDVVVLRDRNLRRIGHRIHTTTELDLIDRATVQDCPTMSGARTLIDMARTHPHPPEQLRIALDSGLRDGAVSESLLHRRIIALRRSGRYGIPSCSRSSRATRSSPARTVGWSGSSSAWSPGPGWRGRRLSSCSRKLATGSSWSTSVSPEPASSWSARVPVPHRTTSQLARDAQRTNALLRDGYLPLQFPYDQIVERPASVIAELRAALAAAA